jgi:hypothetical protein
VGLQHPISTFNSLTVGPNRVDFTAHCDKHAKLQEQLKRTGQRTYGARYTDEEPTKDPNGKEPEPQPNKPEPPKPQQNNTAKVTALPVRGKTGATTTNKTTIERVRGIIARFQPYEDGVEQAIPQHAELPCPDCDFKFRNSQELDEHFLSVYCRGSHIVAYPFYIDSTKPRGYFVEERLVPFDGHRYPSNVQCRKCEQCLPSVQAMVAHEATRKRSSITPGHY